MSNLLEKLQGGDMRSIGRVDEVVVEVGNNAEGFAELIEGLFHEDALIRMRAADAVEKISRKYPELLPPHQEKILRHFAEHKLEDAVKMSMPLLFGYFSLEDEDLGLVVNTLQQWINSTKNKFVKVMCMQGLTDQALKHEWLKDEVIAIIHEQMAKGSASIKARGRILLKKLS